MSEPDFAEAVQALVRACGVPSRRPEPRLAERLVSVDSHRVRNRDGTLAAWRLGSDPAVLLVHGWEDNHSLWSPLIDALAGRRRSVVAFDLPAHGFSDGEWGLHPEAGDGLLAVGAVLGPIDAIVGHSSGAGVAALGVREGLPVDRAVLIAPPLRSDNRWRRYAERLGMSEEVAVAAQGHVSREDRVGACRL